MADNHKGKKKSYTADLAIRIGSNCFTSSGGEILSISAPSTAIGISTAESETNN